MNVAPGELCEGDGECGTNPNLDNYCGGYDLYVRVRTFDSARDGQYDDGACVNVQGPDVGSNLVENSVAGVGNWGGVCTCPDGQAYNVGDNNDGCTSLACVGGVSGPCGSHNPGGSGRRVTCDARDRIERLTVAVSGCLATMEVQYSVGRSGYSSSAGVAVKLVACVMPQASVCFNIIGAGEDPICSDGCSFLSDGICDEYLP